MSLTAQPPLRAVLVTRGAPGSLAIGETRRRQPQPGEVLVKVHAISLNLGEVRRAQRQEFVRKVEVDWPAVVESCRAIAHKALTGH